MRAQKFQLRYSAVEDRVLIIVTGEDDRERVFGLTRRLVKRLVPGLQKIMGDDAFTAPPPAAKSPAASTSKPEGAGTGEGSEPAPVTSANEDTETEPAKPPPPESHLVTRLRIVERPKGTHILQISDAQTTLNVPLNDDQLSQFTGGILTVLERADWDLEQSPDSAPEAGVVPPETSDAEPAKIDISADSPSRYRH